MEKLPWADRPDTEDKLSWCSNAESDERLFVSDVVPQFGGDIVIHPDKATSPYGPDLWLPKSRLPGDLKFQQTPFFTARRYGLGPQYAVTFNVKDFERYRSLYPDIVLFFWVRWGETSYPPDTSLDVSPMEGVWWERFSVLKKAAVYGRMPRHTYRNRVDDECGNAKESFLFDVRNLRPLWFAV
jgi:hypothetical protein